MEEASCAWTAGQLNRSWGVRADVFGAAYGDEGTRMETIYPPWIYRNGRSHPPQRTDSRYLDRGPLTRRNGRPPPASLGAQHTRLGTIATCTEKEVYSKARDVYSLVKLGIDPPTERFGKARARLGSERGGDRQLGRLHRN